MVEAFGSFVDPDANVPTAEFKLKLGATTIVSQAQAINSGHWHLRALLTIRVAGASGSAVASLALLQDSLGPAPFGYGVGAA
jgi:hypothetical protein